MGKRHKYLGRPDPRSKGPIAAAPSCTANSPGAGVGRFDASRFDFAVYAYDHSGRYLPSSGWRRLIVECDDAPDDSELAPISKAKSADVTIRITSAQLRRDP